MRLHTSYLRPGTISRNALLSFILTLCTSLLAAQTTVPVNGLRKNTPAVHALVHARVVSQPGKVSEEATVIVRDGVIEQVGSGISIPEDARVWDLEGKTVYAGLIDAYSELPEDVNDAAVDQLQKSGAPYWNRQITPQLSAAKLFQGDEKQNKVFRSQGITVRLVAPASGIIRGTSALVTTGKGTGSETIVQENVALHSLLTLRRRVRDSYPNSPMGAVALARQALYDAQWYREAWNAFRIDSSASRPERNDALAALQSYVVGEKQFMVNVSDELFFLRADRYAREFNLDILIRGSGSEYRQLDAIKQTNRAVIVPVNFPEPPNVGTPEAAESVSLEQMLHWDLAPENPARLHKAGVTIALCSDGLKSTKEFLNQVRKAVRRGLPKDAALAAMTTTPASLFGVSERLGTIAPGMTANLVITDGDLFDSSTKVLETWVDGTRYEVEQIPDNDLVGEWDITLTTPQSKPLALTLTLKGKPSQLKGTLIVSDSLSGNKESDSEESDGEESEKIKLIKARAAQGRLAITFPGDKLGFDGIARFTAVLEKQGDSRQLQGTGRWGDGRNALLTGKLSEKPTENEAESEKNDGKKEESENHGSENDASEKNKSEKDENASNVAALFDVIYPLGAYGRTSAPEQADWLVFRNATVWTSGSEGILKNASVVVHQGKIVDVGQNIDYPANATVVDATGKHITPGIIDCHSHIATDGGVNESGQAITAEVRIGDFIDSNDINIHRQLAGGVTSSNILHGSANPIGGQNQVIKMRWGSLPEEMKFSQAPQGIKFALGENVKQSNWGERYTTRYPQTRMGVEQIIQDEFEAARVYQLQWKRWNEQRKGLPPRRDLELEAISEVLTGTRLIHCHSYRQDEILALMRTCARYDVRIATLQHILEGYKVAEIMADQQIGGSSFSDWWAYKFEVYDAIPYNGTLMHNAGVIVSFNSDDAELARRLNQEAAKAVKYGRVSPEEALKFVTLNPAKQLRIDQYVGSIENGKHGDLVVWSGSPLSTLSRCEQTWIEGHKYFDREEDLQQRKRVGEMRAKLIQRILSSGEPMEKNGEKSSTEKVLWPRVDEFCRFSSAGQRP